MFKLQPYRDSFGRMYEVITGDSNIKPVRVSAIMLTHNCDDYLQYCIDALKNQVDTIYVLDDGSTDNTLKILRKNKVDHRCVVFDGDLDLSRNMNHNMKRIKTEQWLFYVNPDEILFDLKKNYIGRMCGFLQKNKIHCVDVAFPDFVYNYGTLFAHFDWGAGPGNYWTARRLFYYTGKEKFLGKTHYNIANLFKGEKPYNNEHTGKWKGTVVKAPDIKLFHYGKLRGIERQRGKGERVMDGEMIARGHIATIPYNGPHPKVLKL